MKKLLFLILPILLLSCSKDNTNYPEKGIEMTYTKEIQENGNNDYNIKYILFIKNNSNIDITGDVYRFERSCYSKPLLYFTLPIAKKINVPANSSIEYTVDNTSKDPKNNEKIAFRPYFKWGKGWTKWKDCFDSKSPNDFHCVRKNSDEWEEFVNWQKEQMNIYEKEGWEECK